MAAHDHLHPEQLKMFMSTREIVERYDLLDRFNEQGAPRHSGGTLGWSASGRTPAVVGSHPMTNLDVLRTKLDEYSPRWNREVQKTGVHTPIEIAHDSHLGFFPRVKTGVSNGHHRLAAMWAHDPDALVPVEHINDQSQRRRTEGWL